MEQLLSNIINNPDAKDIYTRMKAAEVTLLEATNKEYERRRLEGDTSTVLPETAEPPHPPEEDMQQLLALCKRLGSGDLTAVAAFKQFKRRMSELQIHQETIGIIAMGEEGITKHIEQLMNANTDE